MNTKQNTPILIAITTLFITAWCATSALGGASLVAIPTLDTDTDNQARAITPDGVYVVGGSGTTLNPATDSGKGFLYNVTNQYLVRPVSSDLAAAIVLTGVGYRTYSGQTELIADGWSGGWRCDWMTTDGGTNWGAKVRANNYPIADNHYTTGPNVNSTGGSLAATPDVFYTVECDTQGGVPQWFAQCSNAWPVAPNWSSKGITSPDTVNMNGVSASGRAVGRRVNGGIPKGWMLTWAQGTPGNTYINGLDGTQAGEAFSVSADGNTVFGRQPLIGTNYGYKVTFSGTTQTSTNALPHFPNTAGSTSLDVPYGCSADGNYAVGMNYRGTEKGVLWNTSDADTNKWTVLDLTELATLHGVLGNFIRLHRPFSIGTSASGDKVITGIGVWSPDGGSTFNTRAFVMTVPMPIRTPLTISNSSPAGFTLSYLGLGNATNVLEYTTNLNLPHTWTPIDTNTSGSIVTVLDPAPTDVQRFYRVVTQ